MESFIKLDLTGSSPIFNKASNQQKLQLQATIDKSTLGGYIQNGLDAIRLAETKSAYEMQENLLSYILSVSNLNLTDFTKYVKDNVTIGQVLQVAIDLKTPNIFLPSGDIINELLTEPPKGYEYFLTEAQHNFSIQSTPLVTKLKHKESGQILDIFVRPTSDIYLLPEVHLTNSTIEILKETVENDEEVVLTYTMILEELANLKPFIIKL